MSPQHTDIAHAPASANQAGSRAVGRSGQLLGLNPQDATAGVPAVLPPPPLSTNLELQPRAARDHYTALNPRPLCFKKSGLGSELEESLTHGNTPPRMRKRLE